jgi:hypothetical protein
MTNFEKFPHKVHSNDPGTALSSWSRQQKIALISGFVLLAVLLTVSACSKQSPKTALVGTASPETHASTTAPTAAPAMPALNAPAEAEKKKTRKARPAAIVTYSDPQIGLSFQYPRKYELVSGDKVGPQIDGLGAVPMNFVQSGGASIVMVAVPAKTYRGTDFTTAFFDVNVNRSLSEQECAQFAVVDTRNPDGEPMDAERLQVGATSMEKTANFSGDALKQAETQYYHRYEGGACYEFVLGLGTRGFGTDENVEAVNHDQVFAALEKILTTVKIQPVNAAHEPIAEQTAPTPTATAMEQAAKK